MRIKITATKAMYKKARGYRGKDIASNCLVARALKSDLAVQDVSCGWVSFSCLGLEYTLPPKANDLIGDFDGRAANLPARLPVSFYVSVPKKDLEAARAAKG